MSLASYFLARVAKLPKRQCRIDRERGIMVPMADGVRLATVLYRPRLKGKHPTILVREPYGLRGFGTVAEAYAERGFNVVLQACRGTDRSEGEFDPFRHEREDGLATLAWIKAQPWFDGRLGTSGPSYLGYTQWAIADAMPRHSAMEVVVSSAEFRSVVLPGGGFALGLWLSWLQTIYGLRGNAFLTARRMATGGIDRLTLKATMKLPLRDADRRVVGREVPFWRHWMENAIGNDAFWEPLDHTHRLGPRTPPVSFLSGWYDFMLDQLLRDYRTLVDAGQNPPLVIGPWWHVSQELNLRSVLETLNFMNAELKGDRSAVPSKPVQIHIGGENRWHAFDAFPPAPADQQIWYLHPDRLLSLRPGKASDPDVYSYDPAEPTPALGGAMFAFTGAGPVDNGPLEARKDVLSFSSEPLFSDLLVIGNVRATLYLRSTLPDTDVFVRLCDVGDTGISTSVADGYIRKSAADPAVPDNIWKLTIRFHATAHLFRRNHRLRLVVTSGAHPRYARNLGTGEPIGDATGMQVADIELFHDPAHPSAITLPVLDTSLLGPGGPEAENAGGARPRRNRRRLT